MKLYLHADSLHRRPVGPAGANCADWTRRSHSSASRQVEAVSEVTNVWPEMIGADSSRTLRCQLAQDVPSVCHDHACSTKSRVDNLLQCAAQHHSPLEAASGGDAAPMWSADVKIGAGMLPRAEAFGNKSKSSLSDLRANENPKRTQGSEGESARRSGYTGSR